MRPRRQSKSGVDTQGGCRVSWFFYTRINCVAITVHFLHQQESEHARVQRKVRRATGNSVESRLQRPVDGRSEWKTVQVRGGRNPELVHGHRTNQLPRASSREEQAT